MPQTILARVQTPQKQANTYLNLDNFSLNKCPKPSWQAFRPSPHSGNAPIEAACFSVVLLLGSSSAKSQQQWVTDIQTCGLIDRTQDFQGPIRITSENYFHYTFQNLVIGSMKHLFESQQPHDIELLRSSGDIEQKQTLEV